MSAPQSLLTNGGQVVGWFGKEGTMTAPERGSLADLATGVVFIVGLWWVWQSEKPRSDQPKKTRNFFRTPIDKRTSKATIRE